MHHEPKCATGSETAMQQEDTTQLTLHADPQRLGPSLHAQKLHIEDEGGVGRDDGREPPGAVGIVGRAGQFSTLPDLHTHHALIPALDHLAETNVKDERRTPIAGRIELGAIGQGPCRTFGGAGASA